MNHSCPPPNPAKVMESGGRPYRSALLPHYALIAKLRADYATWAEVAAALAERGVKITPQGVQSFAARRVKGCRSLLLGGQAEPAAEPRPATPEVGSPNRSRGKPFALNAPPQPSTEPKAMFKSCNDLTKG